MKKFLTAYFEMYFGYDDVRYDWMRYHVCVYIKNNGNVEKFDRQRSIGKFNELLSNPDGSKKLFATYKKLMSEKNDVYAQFLKECDKYLSTQRGRYICIYAK